MDWQQIVALGVVAATAIAFLMQHLRARKSALACSSGCGCGSSEEKAQRPSIKFTARKGVAPERLVKAK